MVESLIIDRELEEQLFVPEVNFSSQSACLKTIVLILEEQYMVNMEHHTVIIFLRLSTAHSLGIKHSRTMVSTIHTVVAMVVLYLHMVLAYSSVIALS